LFKFFNVLSSDKQDIDSRKLTMDLREHLCLLLGQECQKMFLLHDCRKPSITSAARRQVIITARLHLMELLVMAHIYGQSRFRAW